MIADLENGWSPKCHDRLAEPNEWGVLKVSAASSGDYCGEIENKALPEKQTPKKGLEVRVGEVLITRASGVARLVGVAALVESTRDKLMICDKIFRVVDPDNAKVDSHFIAHVLGIYHVRAQIEREFSTKSKMMKNISKPALMDLTFPLPPKPEQITMAKALTDARARATDLRGQARKARAQAWMDFEASVYAVEGRNRGLLTWTAADTSEAASAGNTSSEEHADGDLVTAATTRSVRQAPAARAETTRQAGSVDR